MQFITIALEVLTPAFVSGADQEKVEIRSATIRGLLRFWWRAVRAEHRVERLAREEGAIFGSQELQIRSPLRITVEVSGERLQVIPAGSPAPRSGVQYTYVRQGRQGSTDVLPYLAYGPVRLLSREERQRYQGDRRSPFTDGRGETKRGPLFIRPAIAPGARFEVALSWRAGTLSEDQVLSVVEAAAAWTTLGGIGTRSRKGFGALEGTVSRASSAQLLEQCRSRWTKTRRDLLRLRAPRDLDRVSRYTSLDGASVLVLDPAGSWQEALGEAGLLYKNQRPGGRRRWIGGDAAPRRASSIFLSVIREDHRYKGVLALLPGTRDGTDAGEEEMEDFVREFEQWW